MSHEKSRLLLVDEETVNLELLSRLLNDSGYETACAELGEKAWSMLKDDHSMFCAVLLGSSMPDIDVLDILKRAKDDPLLHSIPFILQIEKMQDKNILEGLIAGAHYHIRKPIDPAYLIAVVNTAIKTFHWQKSLEEKANTLSLLYEGKFGFRTISEGQQLVSLLVELCPESSNLALGLKELVINAIEHGNLNISYDEKSRFLKNQTLNKEITRRLNLDEYKNKYATLFFERMDNQLIFIIEDCGQGFDWELYLEMDSSRMFDSHGRGIAMAKAMSFDELKYENNGSKVTAIVNI